MILEVHDWCRRSRVAVKQRGVVSDVSSQTELALLNQSWRFLVQLHAGDRINRATHAEVRLGRQKRLARSELRSKACSG